MGMPRAIASSTIAGARSWPDSCVVSAEAIQSEIEIVSSSHGDRRELAEHLLDEIVGQGREP